MIFLIEYWYFADTHPDDNLVEEASYETTSVYGFGHPKYYENLFNNLDGKEEAICDGYQGLKSLELVIGAYRSGVFLHLMPVLGAIMAMIIFNEKILIYHFLGAIFIIAGITISNKKTQNA